MHEHLTVTEPVGELTVLVFETRPRWAPELKRQFVSDSVRVRACGSWKDVRDHLAKTDDVLLIVDLAVGAAETLRFLGREVGNRSARSVVVIAEKRSADLEWSLREAGVLQFFTDELSGEELADFCRRQWRMMGTEING